MVTSRALYPVSDIRKIEHAALNSLPSGTLMQRAAMAVTRLAMQLLFPMRHPPRVLVLAGPGNNGGDALLTAAQMAGAGIDVRVLLIGDGDYRSDDARNALLAATAAGLSPEAATPDRIGSEQWHLVIDGLFGIGFSRAPNAATKTLIENINRLSCPIIAIDVPSGLNADTGMLSTGEGVAVQATHTITFIGGKPGLHTGEGRDYAGTVLVDDLDIDTGLFPPSTLHLNHVSWFAAQLRKRRHFSHKGSYGNLLLLGGASGMSGALILASRAALKCGAGKVYAAFIDNPPHHDPEQPEVMCRDAQDVEFSSATLVAGPGLGTTSKAADLLSRALFSPKALVLDADALNLIATMPALHGLLVARSGSTVLTPHPLEAARLLGVKTAVVQNDRVAAARRLAHESGATVILKGSGTIIARPDGTALINTTGNPGLATGGTGDVLAGVCGALLAQGWPAWEAAAAATWMHGKAADMLVNEGTGPIGLTASELIGCVRSVLNRIVHEHHGTSGTAEPSDQPPSSNGNGTSAARSN